MKLRGEYEFYIGDYGHIMQLAVNDTSTERSRFTLIGDYEKWTLLFLAAKETLVLEVHHLTDEEKDFIYEMRYKQCGGVIDFDYEWPLSNSLPVLQQYLQYRSYSEALPSEWDSILQDLLLGGTDARTAISTVEALKE